MSRSTNLECRIFVGNLPEDARKIEVEDLFQRFGKIENLELKQPRGGRGPSFAFIEYDDPRDADDAVHERDGYQYEGQRLRVQFSLPNRGSGDSYRGGGFSSRGRGGSRGRGRGGGPPRRSDHRVLVSGLPATGSWQDIKDHLREAGEVVYADVFRDGTGVVEFARRDDMLWAVKNMDDSKFKSHENETSHIRVKEDGAAARSRSRSRSRSPRRSYSPPRRSPPYRRDSPPYRRSPSPYRRSPSPYRRSPSPRR